MPKQVAPTVNGECNEGTAGAYSQDLLVSELHIAPSPNGKGTGL